MANKSHHILIVGAGITGLLLAQGLEKAGIRYSIFEASEGKYRTREWTLAIHWSLPYLKKCLPAELWDRLKETQCDPAHDIGDAEIVRVYNTQTGELMTEIPVPGMKRVSRRKLQTLCADGIDIQYKKTLKNISYEKNGGVVATFEDGTTTEGTLLVGADGPKSKVRELLLGSEKAERSALNVVQNTTLVKYGDAEKSKLVRSGAPIFCLGYNPNGMFSFISVQEVPDNEKPETWTFQITNSWLGDRDLSASDAEKLRGMKEAARDMAEPFRSASLWMPEGHPIYQDAISYWVTIPWDNHDERVTLAGDAAHPLPPHRGQGLNHCIQDSSQLIDAISGGEANAITQYDAEVVERGSKEVQLSVQSALMVHDWAQLMESPLMKFGLKKKT